MFEFLFKYPRAVFSKGTLVLLGAWPWWVFVLFLLGAGAGLGWLIRSKLPEASNQVKNWRAGVIWLLQFALAALVLLLLWQPAVLVASSGRSKILSPCWWMIRGACPLRTRALREKLRPSKPL